MFVLGLFQKARTFKMRMKGEELGQVNGGRISISGMGGERRQMLECGPGTSSLLGVVCHSLWFPCSLSFESEVPCTEGQLCRLDLKMR